MPFPLRFFQSLGHHMSRSEHISPSTQPLTNFNMINVTPSYAIPFLNSLDISSQIGTIYVDYENRWSRDFILFTLIDFEAPLSYHPWHLPILIFQGVTIFSPSTLASRPSYPNYEIITMMLIAISHFMLFPLRLANLEKFIPQCVALFATPTQAVINIQYDTLQSILCHTLWDFPNLQDIIFRTYCPFYPTFDKFQYDQCYTILCYSLPELLRILVLKLGPFMLIMRIYDLEISFFLLS